MSNAATVILDQISYTYPHGGAAALNACSATFRSGHLAAILGPNGAGKSTVLRAIQKLVTPQQGSISLCGKPLADYSARELAQTIAYVPQRTEIAFPCSVREAVMMGRAAHCGTLGLTGEKDAQLVSQCMKQTGIAHLEHRTLEELSGGELQCAMLARALAQEPRVLLLDEPTSALDLRNQLLVGELLRRLARERGIVIIAIMHDLTQALRHADTLLLIKEGHILAEGPTQETARAELLSSIYNVHIQRVPCDKKRTLIMHAELNEGKRRCLTTKIAKGST